METELLTGEAAALRLEQILPLIREVFADDDDEDDFADLPSEAAEKPGLTLLLAREGNELLGLKLGYRRGPRHFYSWLGGVHPGARGRGVARSLMEEQHRWLREQGYSQVTTETFNRYRPMLLLNIRAGFDVVGTRTTLKGETQIVLRKRLEVQE